MGLVRRMLVLSIEMDDIKVSVASRSSFDESDASVSIFAKGEGRGLTPSVYPQSDTETVIVPVALLK